MPVKCRVSDAISDEILRAFRTSFPNSQKYVAVEHGFDPKFGRFGAKVIYEIENVP